MSSASKDDQNSNSGGKPDEALPAQDEVLTKPTSKLARDAQASVTSETQSVDAQSRPNGTQPRPASAQIQLTAPKPILMRKIVSSGGRRKTSAGAAPSTGEPVMTDGRRYLVLPWATSQWTETKQTLSESIPNIAALDTYMNVHCRTRPRTVSDLFAHYYRSDDAKLDRVPENEFIGHILPAMQRLVLMGPQTFKHVRKRLLLSGETSNVTFTHAEVATLIVCIWFGLFNHSYVSAGAGRVSKQFRRPSFAGVFTSGSLVCLQCLMSYFDRICGRIDVDGVTAGYPAILKEEPRVVVVMRHALEPFDWSKSNAPITDCYISGQNPYATGSKFILVPSHRHVGGDLYKASLTPDQIALLMYPESHVATLICGAMDDNEAIVVAGAEKLSICSGSGSNVRFGGFETDTHMCGEHSGETMLHTALLFADALEQTSFDTQFKLGFERDLDKLLAAMSAIKFPPGSPMENIACGNWTYGFNGTNTELKFLQMLMAASEAHKGLVYCPFAHEIGETIEEFVRWLLDADVTVGQLYKYYRRIFDNIDGRRHQSSGFDVFLTLMEA